MEDKILNEQIEYYRARAEEYDRSLSGTDEMFDPAKSILLGLGRYEHILELACGTGFWTETLLKISGEVTATDAAPEMLQIVRKRLGDKGITYQQLDLFKWQPERQYDMVFFANWLSHVPPKALDEFLDKVHRSTRPGGSVIIVDQYAPSVADSVIAKEEIYAVRPLEDGRQFTIVKVFHDLDTLEDKLKGMGFDVAIHKFTETFFLLSGELRA